MSIDWNALGTWFAGIATLLAVIVALRLQRYYERRDRPSLSVTFDENSKYDLRYVHQRFAGEAGKTDANEHRDRRELWIRVAVESTADVAARDVELRIIEVVREGDEFAEGRSNWWFKTSGLNSTTVQMLPRGIRQPFDIAYISNVSGSDPDVAFYLAIVKKGDIRPWTQERRRIEADDRNNRLDVGWTYLIRFVVLSGNADAVHYLMRLRVNPRRSQDLRTTPLLSEEALRGRLTVCSLSQTAP